MIFIYWDNSKAPKGDVMFACKANTILEADKLFTSEVGKDVVKMPHVGVQWFAISPKSKEI